MLTKNEQFELVLRNSGHSMTTARRHVFQTLAANHPVTMAELVRLCQSAADRASVYRTTQLFEKVKIVTRLNIGWKYQLELSDHFSHHHHHLTCIECGRVVQIKESAAIEQAIIRLTTEAGFAPDSHQLEVNGLCRDCQTTL